MSPLGSYVEWQHAQVSTPRPLLAEFVRRATGSGIDQVERIVEGYSNEVYRVRCTDGQDVVIRILRFDDDTSPAASQAEAAAIEKARAAGVPVPEILLLDTARIDGTEFPVMVQRTVPGRPLSDVINQLAERQRHDVLVEIGGLIARINGINVEDEPDWQTAMAADLAHRYANRDKIIDGGFSPAQFDRMLDLLQGYVRDFPCNRWVLCHGDLSPKHIFVTADGSSGAGVRVSGVVDFGDWKAGAPVHDLAVLRVRGPLLDLTPLLHGYGAPTDQAYRRQLDLHTLLIALGSLEIGVDEQDQACIERSRHQIRTLLADLDDPGFRRPGSASDAVGGQLR
ncbi:Ser/Thr protein kinase RdoA involved in Cpx stress response, MazF antagonist [Actinopolymorpha singaporensis]|uniref:Ser/Thr protein kinase RdoA involved in Cpx stress response, MazF antagonist n=1 Tax=Actinopolymorpha singaporensis TaxID=117157 RepID=A0A1H1TUU2_9ACTN|nr:Ser/Thr protein kinase RdoA involved in Cpx stress response, MazF antagonist [Actinopolymorpha singaporensis]